MTNDEIKAFISAKVSEGISLSKIQDALLNEKGVRMTYMELRMLASEIETADSTIRLAFSITMLAIFT